MGDYIVIGLVVLVAILAYLKIRKNKKKGVSPCGCGSCPSAGTCHSYKEESACK